MDFSFLQAESQFRLIFYTFKSILGSIQRDLDSEMKPKAFKNDELKKHYALNLG